MASHGDVLFDRKKHESDFHPMNKQGLRQQRVYGFTPRLNVESWVRMCLFRFRSHWLYFGWTLLGPEIKVVIGLMVIENSFVS